MKSTDNNAEADGESTKEETGSAIQQEPKKDGKATGQGARLVYYTTISVSFYLHTFLYRVEFNILIRKFAAVSGSTNRIFC